jgi:hypothetical protein
MCDYYAVLTTFGDNPEVILRKVMECGKYGMEFDR